MKIVIADDPALEAELRSVASLIGASPEEVARQAIREGLPAVEARRTTNIRDWRRRRDFLEAELAAVERMIELHDKGR